MKERIEKRKAELAEKRRQKEAEEKPLLDTEKGEKDPEAEKDRQPENKEIIIPEQLADVEVTKLPQILGKQFELYDEDNCLRPTIIKHT